MIDLTTITLKYDNGGRRFGVDRRQYSYAVYMPERRSGEERRGRVDRRDMENLEFKEEKERRAVFLDT